MCLTETHLQGHHLDAELQIQNYTIFRQDRINREKGGSAVYIHNSITAAVIESFEAPDSLAVQLDLCSCKLIIVCVYRSQSLTHAENCKIIEEINKLDLNANTELFIVGDFNLPDVLWDYGSVNCPVDTINATFLVQRMFMEFFQHKGFHWMLKDGTVTRRTMYGETLQESHLDQVLVANQDIISSVEVVSAVGKSDHLGILSIL